MKNQGRGYTVINNEIRCDFCTALYVIKVLANWGVTCTFSAHMQVSGLCHQLRYTVIKVHTVTSKGPHGRSSTQSIPFLYFVPSPLTEYLQQVAHYIQWRNTVHLVWNNKIIKVSISIKNWSPCATYYKTGQHSCLLITLPCITYLTIRYNIMGQRRGKLVSTAYTRYTC